MPQATHRTFKGVVNGQQCPTPPAQVEDLQTSSSVETSRRRPPHFRCRSRSPLMPTVLTRVTLSLPSSSAARSWPWLPLLVSLCVYRVESGHPAIASMVVSQPSASSSELYCSRHIHTWSLLISSNVKISVVRFVEPLPGIVISVVPCLSYWISREWSSVARCSNDRHQSSYSLAQDGVNVLLTGFFGRVVFFTFGGGEGFTLYSRNQHTWMKDYELLAASLVLASFSQVASFWDPLLSLAKLFSLSLLCLWPPTLAGEFFFFSSLAASRLELNVDFSCSNLDVEDFNGISHGHQDIQSSLARAWVMASADSFLLLVSLLGVWVMTVLVGFLFCVSLTSLKHKLVIQEEFITYS